MASTVATGTSVGLVGVKKVHSFTSKPFSPFLGKKLRSLQESSTHKKLSTSKILASGGEISNLVHDLFLGVGVGLPCTVMECGDIIYRSTLPRSDGITLTVPGVILALGTLSYLWATPGVAPGFFDMFVLAFAERIFRPTYKKVYIYLLLAFDCVVYCRLMMDFVGVVNVDI